MESLALTGLVIGLAIAIFLGTVTLLAGILGVALSRGEDRESLLGPMMVEDVLEDELRNVYQLARLLETESDQVALAREVRRYVIEIQARRCETGDEIVLDDRIRGWVERGAGAPAEARKFVRRLRRELARSEDGVDPRLDSEAV